MNEPTSAQCNACERVDDGWACWYPQMGGGCGKAILVPHSDSGCFEVYVWHDGEFAFGGEDQPDGRKAVRLHHCDAEQFIEFGQFAKKIVAETVEDPET